MADVTERKGRAELRQARASCTRHFWAVLIFSIFVNLLMLTGPIFMLQTYDRVLSSRSEETLLVLLVLVTFLFIAYGALEFARGRVLARAGAKFQTLMDHRIFEAVLRRSVAPSERAQPNTAARDLDAVRQLLSGPAPFALFDVPWTPIFLAAIFIFHPILGWIAVAGGLILIALTIANQLRSNRPNAESQMASARAENMGEAMRQNAEAIQGLGMRGIGLSRWQGMRTKALESQIVASDRTASYSSASKALRFYLQSFMLAAGAWLALKQEISPGMMIAASILMGRALAPIEQAIGQWALFQRAMRGWRALAELLGTVPAEQQKTQLPAPRGYMTAKGVAVVAPGETAPTLRGIEFAVKPGEAMGVIGPSGAGKTTLAKVLTGLWRPAAGSVRLDGASLDQWDSDVLGRYFGYLPQEIGLLSGTVADNIARMDIEPDPEAVVQAAKRAGAYDLLVSLPKGFDTEIGAGGQRLSGGQRQRVALARALYGDPPVIVLDEPNANLDAQGEQALVDAIREAKARERAVIVMAHRPSAIAACDTLLMIDKGHQVDFGPRDEVLRKRTKNFAQAGQQGKAVPQQPGQSIPQVPGMPPGATPSPGQPGPVAPTVVRGNAPRARPQQGAQPGATAPAGAGAGTPSPQQNTPMPGRLSPTQTTIGMGPPKSEDRT